jgi:hypothetical protein
MSNPVDCIGNPTGTEYVSFYSLSQFTPKYVRVHHTNSAQCLFINMEDNAGPPISEISNFLQCIVQCTPANGVYISQLIRYARACSTYDQFLI